MSKNNNNEHSERRQRIQHLVRKNERKMTLPQYLNGLSRAIGIEVTVANLAELKETGRVYETFKTEYQLAHRGGNNSSQKIIIKNPDLSEVGAVFQNLSVTVDDQRVIIFCGDFETCGALQLQSLLAVSKIVELLSVDKDFVGIFAPNEHQGLVLDAYEEIDGVPTIELVIWGNRWASAFTAAAFNRTLS